MAHAVQSSSPSKAANISLAAIIATANNHQSQTVAAAPSATGDAPRRPGTGFYVDMSTSSRGSRQQSPSVNGAQRQSAAPAAAGAGDQSRADRSHLFSMFIDFAEPSIHSPRKPPLAAVRRNPAEPAEEDDNDCDDAVVLRRKPQLQPNPGSTATSSGRQSWSNVPTCFSFDETGTSTPRHSLIASHQQKPAVAAGDSRPMTNLPVATAMAVEDSCSASVASADHGYQSLPMPLGARSSRSRQSVQSLASTDSPAGCSSREEQAAAAAGGAGGLQQPQPPPRTKTRRWLQQHQQQRQQLEEDRYSKDSVDEASCSEAEASGGGGGGGGGGSQHSSLGDLRAVPLLANKPPPLSGNAAHQLRKNNSLSHVGEQMWLANGNSSANSSGSQHTMESLQATMERQQKLLLLETVNEETPMASFVKLSDMDNRLPPMQAERAEQFGGGSGEVKMTRSSVAAGGGKMSAASVGGRANMSRSMGTNLSNLASTEDTLRSLSRLFPHLSQELALSPTADLPPPTLPQHNASGPRSNHNTNTTSAHSGGGDQSDYMLSDLSAVSSVTSSFSRSGGLDSTDDWSMSSRQPRRLGEDLLKMFLQEIATDCTLDVAGRPIRAHKCILRSRCQYFAAMLAGQNAAAATQQQRIQLAGYSFGSVHFALCHIYSGAAHPPQGISLFELAALADQLALEGLKEVAAHSLRSHYCHNFHKPCSGCIDGIMRVFPVTLQHGLDELYHKCLRWTCKHYVTVWSTRAFALLPADLIERCVQYVVAHVNSETVLTLLLNCDHLVTVLSSCRWALGVENTVRDLIDTARAYVADHFANLLASDCFLSLGQDQCANIARLETLLLRTASTLTPEQACRSYQRVTRLNTALRAKVRRRDGGAGGGGPAASSDSSSSSESSGAAHMLANDCDDGDDDGDGDGDGAEDASNWNREFLRFVEAIALAVEHCLTRQCARAMRTQQWQRMELELRKRVQGLACLTDSMDSKRSAKSGQFGAEAGGGGGWSQAANSNQNRQPHRRAHHHHPADTDLLEVKLAIETLSKRSKLGRYAGGGSGQVGGGGGGGVVGSAERRIVERLARTADSNLDKVTKLRKPTIVPHYAGPPPAAHHQRHTFHESPLKTAPVPTQSTARNPRLFKHSLSHDPSATTAAAATHRPPAPNAAPPRNSAGGGGHRLAGVVRSASTAARFAEIRPRYLEPKTRPVAAQSVDNLTSGAGGGGGVGGGAAPLSKQRIRPTTIGSTRSVNSLGLSRDSLGPGAGKSMATASGALGQRRLQHRSQTIMSQDSLNSRRTANTSNCGGGSSAATGPNRSMSRDSLAKSSSMSRLRRPDPVATTTANNNSGNSGSNTGSTNTTRSSRFSTANGGLFMSSPRDSNASANSSIQARLRTLPVAVQPQPRRSFLSAKSREILAKRSAGSTVSLQRAESLRAPAIAASASLERGLAAGRRSGGVVGGINKSSSTSNIPLRTTTMATTTTVSNQTSGERRRTMAPGQTTLHLRRTAHLQPAPSGSVGTEGDVVVAKKAAQTATNMQIKCLDMRERREAKATAKAEAEAEAVNDRPENTYWTDRRMERSMTFCKDASDLDASQLTIVE